MRPASQVLWSCVLPFGGRRSDHRGYVCQLHSSSWCGARLSSSSPFPVHKMIRAFLSAMAKSVFLYNGLQGTQRQRPIVATLILTEAAIGPQYEADACRKEIGQGQDVASVATTTTTQWVNQPIVMVLEKSQSLRQTLELHGCSACGH